MTAWPSDVRGRVYVAGVGLGTCLGRQPGGAYLVMFPHIDCTTTCLPDTVFELTAAEDRPICAFATERGSA